MDTWVIVLIVLAVGLLLIYGVQKYKKYEADKNSHGGAALVKAAEQIPVYGSTIKAVATVAKPVNQALDKVNKGITTGLQHIPVVGKYLAMPNQVAGSAVKKVTNWLGF